MTLEAPLSVAADALVVSDGDSLWLTRGPTRLHFKLDEAVDPHALLEAVTEDLAGLASLLDPADAASVRRTIEHYCAVGPRLGDSPRPAGVRRLAEVLRTIAAGDLPDEQLASTIVLAGTQALWTAHEPKAARQSLRFFISMMADPHRRGAYAALVAGRDIAIREPDTPAIGLPAAIATDDRLPCEYAFTVGRWNRVASMRPELDPERGSTLGPAVVDELAAWPEPKAPLLTFAFGRTAAPNLAVLGPGDEDRDFVNGIKGAAHDEGLARLKCVAEGVERFVAGDLQIERLVKARAVDLDGQWLNPADIIAYSPRQRREYDLEPFDSERQEWWVRASGSSGDCWVPAAIVYAPFPSTPRWLRYGAVTSNGIAAHSTPQRAAEHAWLELVERDAFMRMWYGRVAPPRLPYGALSADASALAASLEPHGDLALLLLPNADGVPVVVARLDGAEHLCMGAGAAWQPEVAARSALVEACSQIIAPPVSDNQDDAAVRSPIEHGALYASPARRRDLAWMLEGAEPKMLDSAPRKELPDRILTFHFAGRPEWPVDVVRVLDPQLIPLTFGYDSDLLGRPDVAALLAQRDASMDLPAPIHPFA